MSHNIFFKPVGLKGVDPFDLDVELSILGAELNRLITAKTGLNSSEFNLMHLGKTISEFKNLEE
jgi:hypothetical protein